MNYFKEFFKGVWEKNPILVLGIGMCPTLAVIYHHHRKLCYYC